MTIKATRSPLHNNWKSVSTTTYTIVNEEVIVCDPTSNAINLTLPPSSATGGRRELTIIDNTGQAATNNITLTAAGSDTINGAATYVITSAYAMVRLVDGGGGKWSTSTNATLTATAAEINNRDHGQPALATISPAAGASNICLVTITVKDGAGVAITGPTNLVVTLSDASSGAGLTATTASGNVVAGASGVDLATLVAKKALHVQTTAAGVYILSITDAAKTGFYVCAFIPGLKGIVSAQLVTGNYGP